uniref:Uncharacterized protein n=1 Tax=Cannabis sativa TaxID=3483 RepID=A0A803NHK9_CANSA
MSSVDDTQERLSRVKQYLESLSASRSLKNIIDNRLFQPLGPMKQPQSTDPESDSDDSVNSHRTVAQNRTLKELVALDLDQQPLCIHYPPLDVNFELKLGFIHSLLAFRGLPGEDTNKHLNELHIVCSSMKPPSVTEEQIKMR